MSASSTAPLRVGVGGPVGSGKTALLDALCKRMRDDYEIAVVTNDIYTREDAEFLTRSEALPPERIVGVETGGCPHTAIREDASMNLAAVDGLFAQFPQLELVFVESGGDNLSATFSPELADLTIYVIDVSEGEKIPRKGGPGITRSDLLVINKIDLAPYVGASLEVMDNDTRRMRGERPWVFTNLKVGQGLDEIVAFIEREGMLAGEINSRFSQRDIAMSSQALIFELNEKSFAQAALLNSHKAPVLVEFMGVWSGPCIALESRLTELAQEFPEQFVFAKVDIDEQPALRKQYRIENVPTLVVFRDGKPVRTEVGELSADDLRVLLRDFGVFRPSDEMREQARARHVAGDTAAAVQLLGEAARSDPGNTRIALDMVQIMIDVGHLDDARSLFERLPEAIRESDAGNALKGQLAFADLAAKTAGIGALQARLAAAPEDHDARFDLAICEVARHDFDAAMEALFHVQARDPAFRDGAAREMIVALINMLTANHPESAAEYRRRLANLLSE